MYTQIKYAMLISETCNTLSLINSRLPSELVNQIFCQVPLHIAVLNSCSIDKDAVCCKETTAGVGAQVWTSNCGAFTSRQRSSEAKKTNWTVHSNY